MFFSKLQKRDEANDTKIKIWEGYKNADYGPLTSDPRVTSHLSLLPSGNGSQGISTNRPSPLSTASLWMVWEAVGWLLKCSIRGQPAPAGSSVTVNFLSYNQWQTNTCRNEPIVQRNYIRHTLGHAVSVLTEYSCWAVDVWSRAPFPRPPGIFRGGWGASGTPQRPWTSGTTTTQRQTAQKKQHTKLQFTHHTRARKLHILEGFLDMNSQLLKDNYDIKS